MFLQVHAPYSASFLASIFLFGHFLFSKLVKCLFNVCFWIYHELVWELQAGEAVLLPAADAITDPEGVFWNEKGVFASVGSFANLVRPRNQDQRLVKCGFRFFAWKFLFRGRSHRVLIILAIIWIVVFALIEVEKIKDFRAVGALELRRVELRATAYHLKVLILIFRYMAINRSVPARKR